MSNVVHFHEYKLRKRETARTFPAGGMYVPSQLLWQYLICNALFWGFFNVR